MNLGAVYPQTELRGDPDAVRAIGAALVALGYDHLLAYDHVLGAVHADRTPKLTGPYTEDDPFHDPFVLFSYLAGRHERLEFVTGVIILPQRQTALVAKQAADLAVLSGGRLTLGVGVGWNPVEYEALGQEFGVRGARAEEQIGLLRRLWSEHVVTFEGRFDRVDRAGILPRPAAPIPVWIGGFSEPAFRRAARLGDGFIFAGGGAQAADQWAHVRRLLAEQGRPAEGFGAMRALRGRRAGEAAAVADAVADWEAVGGTHASIVTMGLGLDSAEAHIDYLGRVATALGRP